MVGQHRGMQHVRIRQHQIRFAADSSTLGSRGVAVVNTWPNRGRQLRIAADHFQQTLELVLRQRFRWKEVQARAFGIGERGFQDRQVVAKRLAARGAGGDHEVVISRAASSAAVWCE